MKFSEREKKDLLKAWFLLSIAFALLLTDSFGSELLIGFVIVGITAGAGFLLHEIAHKYYAIKFGYRAEFVADTKMLLLAVLMALFLPIVFAAPGAVMIQGYVSRRENGIISVAGPITNIILAILFLPLAVIPLPFVNIIGFYGTLVNAFLAAFNMIPIGNLDGSKVLRWNKTWYWSVLSISVALTFLAFSLG